MAVKVDEIEMDILGWAKCVLKLEQVQDSIENDYELDEGGREGNSLHMTFTEQSRVSERHVVFNLHLFIILLTFLK